MRSSDRAGAVRRPHTLIGRPLRPNELGGVAAILQAFANDVCLIILSPEDTFGEILDEVEVFAPGGKNVLLADLSTHLVGIVVPHQAKVRIYRGTDFLQ